jgi:hypothetical protein
MLFIFTHLKALKMTGRKLIIELLKSPVMRPFYFIITFILLISYGYSQNPPALPAVNAKTPGEILFSDDFRNPAGTGSNYIIEGGKVFIAEGLLHLQANPAAGDTYPKEAGIWIRRSFDGDLSVEFEMTSLSAHRNATDLQLFLFFKAAGGSPIANLFTANAVLPMKTLKAQKGLIAIDFANTAEHDGKVLSGTIVNSPTCLLLYSCPGGTLLSTAYTSAFLVGKPYKIKAEYRDHQLLFYIDGTLAAQGEDTDSGKQQGAIGFRTYMNDLTISNLVIRRMP